MTFERFRRMVLGGEKATVDFKLTCNAFNRAAGDQEKARAELVKDICAMANNGPTASYLIIGVGNDRQTLQSVTDSNLKSENVQSLVRDAIHPRPVIRVLHLRWDNVPKPFGGVQFVVIQVGPNAKQAFRLAKDYINWEKRFHFRKNEAWVRNEDTSDLATPEQIVGLVAKRQRAAAEPQPDFTNTDYNRLVKAEQLCVLARDVMEFFNERGFHTLTPREAGHSEESREPRFWLLLPSRGKKFFFRCYFAESMRIQGSQSRSVYKQWRLEHGLWTFLLGNFTKTAASIRLSLDVKEAWGTVQQLAPSTIGWFGRGSILPQGFSAVPITLLTSPRLANTKRVRESVSEALEHLEADDLLFQHLDTARHALNTELQRWKKKSPSVFAGGWRRNDSENPDAFKRIAASITALLKNVR